MRIWRAVVCGTLLAWQAVAAPAIAERGVVNAASNIAPGLPNYGIARGSLFLVKGSGFGEGASVSVTIGDQTLSAPVVKVVDGTQITARLPLETPNGDGTVTVTYAEETSAAAPIKVVDRAFGIFTTTGGMAVTLPAVTPAQPAQAGQALTLYGTGLGEGDIEVWVGSKQATVTNKGASGGEGLDAVGFAYAPGTAGLEQIDIQVPEGAQGCRVPVVVRTGNVVSNFAGIPVMPQGGACADASGLGADDYGRVLTSGGTYKIGSVTLSRSSSKVTAQGQTVESKADSASASFQQIETSVLAANLGYLNQTAMGACTVVTFVGKLEDIPQVKVTYLDAGASLSLTGPKGAKSLEKKKDDKGAWAGNYFVDLGTSMTIPGVQLPPGLPGIPGLPAAGGYLDAGDYRVTAPGAEVGAFTANLKIPEPLTWTNQDKITEVDRGSGLTIEWTGGDPNSFVYMNGTSFDGTAIAMFYCSERASANTFTVPAVVLLSLPASSGALGGMLSVSNTVQAKFTASNLDLGLISSSVSSQKSVVFK
ncbi:MAG: IPT/TIG domain-containing protein [Bryobacteraceae bacterium]